MKKESARSSKVKNGEMRPEYDFSKAVRGKHCKPLHEGYSVYVHKADGTTLVQHYKLEEGVVILEPDVRPYFPDSDSVNAALRSLITLMSEMRVPPGKKRTAQHRAKSVKV